MYVCVSMSEWVYVCVCLCYLLISSQWGSSHFLLLCHSLSLSHSQLEGHALRLLSVLPTFFAIRTKILLNISTMRDEEDKQEAGDEEKGNEGSKDKRSDDELRIYIYICQKISSSRCEWPPCCPLCSSSSSSAPSVVCAFYRSNQSSKRRRIDP